MLYITPFLSVSLRYGSFTSDDAGRRKDICSKNFMLIWVEREIIFINTEPGAPIGVWDTLKTAK